MSNIKLRELARADLSLINTWRNDPEIIKFLGANFNYIGLEIDERWFESYISTRNTSVRLAIIDSDINRCIGLVNLTSIHPINRSAEFSIMIGDKEYWSHGVGRQATEHMIDHGFANLNLNRIYLTVLTDNVRAYQLYKKTGFKEEGVLREAVFKDGVFRDFIMMSLLQKDYYDRN